LQKCCGQLVDLVVVHADAKWRDLIGLVHRGPDDVDLRTASTGAWCTEGYRRLGTVVSLPAWLGPRRNSSIQRLRASSAEQKAHGGKAGYGERD
jgi:hypothetical protein